MQVFALIRADEEQNPTIQDFLPWISNERDEGVCRRNNRATIFPIWFLRPPHRDVDRTDTRTSIRLSHIGHRLEAIRERSCTSQRKHSSFERQTKNAALRCLEPRLVTLAWHVNRTFPVRLVVLLKQHVVRRHFERQHGASNPHLCICHPVEESVSKPPTSHDGHWGQLNTSGHVTQRINAFCACVLRAPFQYTTSLY